MKKIIILAMTLAIVSTSCVFAEEYAFHDVDIIGKPSDWNSKQAVFDQWSFYVTNQFYNVATYKDKETYIYNEETEIRKNPAVFANVYQPIAWQATQSELKRSGLVIASNKGENVDNNWRCALEVYPGNRDNAVRFVTAPRVKDCMGPVTVTSCFTVPENGYYRVVTDVKNYGWSVNGLVGYGEKNMARVSILTGEDIGETAENSVEFEILNQGDSSVGFDSGIKMLTQGDRIYLSVYNGNDGNLDDFFGTHTITLCNESGEVQKSFSLGDTAFTSTNHWNFYKSSPDNMNMYLYTPIYAVKSEWLSSSFGYTGGYAATPISDWNDEKVSMSKTGSIGWNKGEDFFTAKTAEEDIIVACNIDKDGEYLVKVSAENTGYYQLSDGGVVGISVVNNDLNEDSNVLGQVIIPASSNEEVTYAKLQTLRAGNKVNLRINKNSSATADIFKMHFSISEADSLLGVKCMSGTKEIKAIKDIVPGELMTAEVKFTNYENFKTKVSIFAAIYNEDDMIVQLAALPPEEVKEFGEKTFHMEFTPNQQGKKLIFFAWDDFMNASALKKMTVIE